jgi:hypothetical protein
VPAEGTTLTGESGIDVFWGAVDWKPVCPGCFEACRAADHGVPLTQRKALMGGVPWDVILEDPTLSPAEKYGRLRAAYPSFSHTTIRFALHEQYPKGLPFEHVDRLIEAAEGGTADLSSLCSLTAAETHYFALYYVWRSGIADDERQLTPLRRVLKYGNCDRGTASFLYWAASEAARRPAAGELEGKEAEQYCEWVRKTLGAFGDEVAQRLRAGSFKSETISYDPAEDHSPEALRSGEPGTCGSDAGATVR